MQRAYQGLPALQDLAAPLGRQARPANKVSRVSSARLGEGIQDRQAPPALRAMLQVPLALREPLGRQEPLA